MSTNNPFIIIFHHQFDQISFQTLSSQSPTSLCIDLALRSLRIRLTLLTLSPLILEVVVNALAFVLYQRLSSLASHTLPIRHLEHPFHAHASLCLCIELLTCLAFYTNAFALFTDKRESTMRMQVKLFEVSVDMHFMSVKLKNLHFPLFASHFFSSYF